MLPPNIAMEVALTGDNITGSTQIFSINSDGTGLTQVTSGDLSVDDLAFADDGNRVAFGSARNPFGTNNPNTEEIFVIDIDGTNLMQLTETAGDSVIPRISNDGNRVAFAQAGEVWVHTIDAATTVQITNGTNFPSGRYAMSNLFGSYDISGNGLTVVFASAENHTGDNPDNYHTIFSARADGMGTITQVLRDGQVSAASEDFFGDVPVVVNDAAGLLFISDTNLTSFTQPISEYIYTTVIE